MRGLGYEQGYITSMDTVTQVSKKFRKEKKVNKNMGISIDHNTNHTYIRQRRRTDIWAGLCVYQEKYTKDMLSIRSQEEREQKGSDEYKTKTKPRSARNIFICFFGFESTQLARRVQPHEKKIDCTTRKTAT